MLLVLAVAGTNLDLNNDTENPENMTDEITDAPNAGQCCFTAILD